MVGGSREGWHDYDQEFCLFSRRYERTALKRSFYCTGAYGNDLLSEQIQLLSQSLRVGVERSF